MVPAFFSKAMILFNCDYSEGAHADILRRMAETNMEQPAGYIEDMNHHNHLSAKSQNSDWLFLYELPMVEKVQKWLNSKTIK